MFLVWPIKTFALYEHPSPPPAAPHQIFRWAYWTKKSHLNILVAEFFFIFMQIPLCQRFFLNPGFPFSVSHSPLPFSKSLCPILPRPAASKHPLPANSEWKSWYLLFFSWWNSLVFSNVIRLGNSDKIPFVKYMNETMFPNGGRRSLFAGPGSPFCGKFKSSILSSSKKLVNLTKSLRNGYGPLEAHYQRTYWSSGFSQSRFMTLQETGEKNLLSITLASPDWFRNKPITPDPIIRTWNLIEI